MFIPGFSAGPAMPVPSGLMGHLRSLGALPGSSAGQEESVRTTMGPGGAPAPKRQQPWVAEGKFKVGRSNGGSPFTKGQVHECARSVRIRIFVS